MTTRWSFDEPRSLLSPLSTDEYRDLMSAPTPAAPNAPPSDVQLRRCSVCRCYAPQGSLAAGESLCCHAPLISPVTRETR